MMIKLYSSENGDHKAVYINPIYIKAITKQKKKTGTEIYGIIDGYPLLVKEDIDVVRAKVKKAMEREGKAK